MTENEILEALQDAMSAGTEDVPNAYTLVELGKMTKKTDKPLRRGIRYLQEKNAVEVVWVRRPSIDGRWRLVPAYKLRV